MKLVAVFALWLTCQKLCGVKNYAVFLLLPVRAIRGSNWMRSIGFGRQIDGFEACRLL